MVIQISTLLKGLASGTILFLVVYLVIKLRSLTTFIKKCYPLIRSSNVSPYELAKFVDDNFADHFAGEPHFKEKNPMKMFQWYMLEILLQKYSKNIKDLDDLFLTKGNYDKSVNYGLLVDSVKKIYFIIEDRVLRLGERDYISDNLSKILQSWVIENKDSHQEYYDSYIRFCPFEKIADFLNNADKIFKNKDLAESLFLPDLLDHVLFRLEENFATPGTEIFASAYEIMDKIQYLRAFDYFPICRKKFIHIFEHVSFKPQRMVVVKAAM